MALIQLHRPVASTTDQGVQRFERVHMFPGRHLGEEEFDREQAYADLRLAALLRGRTAGIIAGLEINLGPRALVEGGFSVSAGLALDGQGQTLGLQYPLRLEWDSFIGDHLTRTGSTDPTGVYYLLLRRSSRRVGSPAVDACQRFELDPTRDTRLLVTGELELQRLNISPAAVATTPRETIENWIAADRVDAGFLTALGNAVPLALLAITATPTGFRVEWVSQEAGRYLALPDGGYRVLLDQTSAAFRRVMQRVANEVTAPAQLPQFLGDNLKLDFLPAAGQLPLEWLRDVVDHPRLLWLPPHIGLDMVPVPEPAVPELLQRHLARWAIDLRRPAGDKVRLLLAVQERDYRKDLLDVPPTDARLEQDIYRFHVRAHEAWRRWHQQFDVLYHLAPSGEAGALDPIERPVRDPAQFRHLDLPRPEAAPVRPATFFEETRARADAELDPDNPTRPYPFDQPVPPVPAFYTRWLVGGAPPPKPEPAGDGLVVQYAMSLVQLEAMENQLRALRGRLEKTRDFMLLMRQQLDSQTVALAALAGGVAGDGSGLQVARWLPYAGLDASIAATDGSAPATPTRPAPPPLAVATTAAPASTNFSFSGSLMKSVLTTTSGAAVAKTLLTSKPETFSAFELGINKSRMELLARVTREAVAKPAFQTKEYRFGVLDHISPEVNEYAKAYYGMKDLLATLTDLFDATDALALGKQLKAIGQPVEDPGTGTSIDPFKNGNRLEDPAAIDRVVKGQAGEDDKKFALLSSQYRYHGLFKAGRVLTQWIAVCESRYNQLERRLQGKLREQAAKLAQIEKLAGLIRVGRETLESIDRFRVEQLGDYGVAQRLLDEDWRRVYAVDQERRRILTGGLRGLYYVRVRTAPISAGLADPLALRHGSSRDVVPGCDWEEDVELPEALEPFFQTVCEIPMRDWARLEPLATRLPPFERFELLHQLRQSRFKARPLGLRTSGGNDTLQARLQTVHLQNRAVLQTWASLHLPALQASLLRTQAEAAKVLSLEDLLQATGTLRREAEELRRQLEQCAHCLLERLALLPGSVRLQWGQLAEDDHLRVEEVSWWPGLERAEADDFNATRTVAELIGWWFRQVAPGASASSRSAMRNMVRAVLIHASLGDPQEILRGNVRVAPRTARVGERLQLKLNRAPLPGTRLQLLDAGQRVVALLAVEDHTADSTVANIVQMVHAEVKINTRFTVLGAKGTAGRG